MSYLRYLCLFAYSRIQHILCCVFVLFFVDLLSVSVDCPFLIALSVLSNFYLTVSVRTSCMNLNTIMHRMFFLENQT
jgi:hypothetical protein